MNKRAPTRKMSKGFMAENLPSTVAEIARVRSVKAIYLFGSQARGKAKPISDVDLCVFTDQASSEEQAGFFSSSSPHLDVRLFHTLPIYIQYRIFQEGRVLYCSDQLYLHRQRARTVQQYLDFKPLVERHVKRTLER